MKVKPEFIMFVGLPASGKSTKAKELGNKYNIHSSDEIRKELLGNENSQNNNELVFTTLHKRIKTDLKNGISCIYDACNISYKRRMGFLEELKNIDCYKICYIIATPYEECLKNNQKRERKIPEEVITKMYHKFNVPYWYEGWDDICIEYPLDDYKKYYGTIDKFIDEYGNYNQHNSHHKLTLGSHCCQTAFKVMDLCQNIPFIPRKTIRLLCDTAFIHDIGKPKVATFINSKGEKTDECHYYNHQYCGAYDSLFYEINELYNCLDMAIRIMWHMQPYFWGKDNNLKQQNKYKKLWGEKLYKDIMLLHKADKVAH